MPGPPTDVEPDTDWRTGSLMAGVGFAAAFVLVAMLGVTVLAIGTSDDEGADEAPAAGTETGSLTIVATEFAFDPPLVQSGTDVALTMINEGAAFHNLEIEGVEGFLLEAEAGETAAGTIELAAGDYVLFCSVPGHREAGMVGALAVG